MKHSLKIFTFLFTFVAFFFHAYSFNLGPKWAAYCAPNSMIDYHDVKRKVLVTSICFLSGILLPICNDGAVAFDNATPNNYKMPKSNGPKPTNLGFDKKGLLRPCLKASPNCFSTTSDSLTAIDADDGSDDHDDEDAIIDSHALSRWRYTKGSAEEAFNLIGGILETYEPGQSNIDGGGFKIVTKDDKKHYYYVQYESLKRGYIDDLEIAVDNDASVQVVSSSRLGYLDYAVNAKR